MRALSQKTGQSGAHCHKYIAKVAKELAAAQYEILMGDNLIWANWKKANPDLVRGPTVDSKKLQLRFVQRKWGLFIEAARATLVGVLQQPIDEAVKEEIMHILALDSTLIRGRQNPARVAGVVQQKN